MAFVLVGWLGASLVLSEQRWFRRRSLVRRVVPYLPGPSPAIHNGPRTRLSFEQRLTRFATDAGTRLARACGVGEELDRRLERIHSSLDAGSWRFRQFGWMFGGGIVASFLVAAVRPPAVIAVLFVVGLPSLAFLVLEHRVTASASRWQRRVFLELPVVIEQLGMLLSAGYSVSAAVQRLGERGHGACAADFRRVCARIRCGLGEGDALAEWADISEVPAVTRVVATLALDREAGDLGRLITQEARAVREEVHRQLIETFERRAQQVWVPVTVATLVPGVIFLAVPFVAAMQLFTTT